MKCSEELQPNWSEYLKGDPIPGIQPLLLLSGKDKLKINGAPNLTWQCYGLYNIIVNNGGLETEDLADPPLDYYNKPLPSISPWRKISKLADWLEEEKIRAIVNPLSWDPLTPIIIRDEEGPPGCIRFENYSIYTGRLDPHRSTKLAKCSRRRGKPVNTLKLSRFILKGYLKVLKTGSIKIARFPNECYGFFSDTSGVVVGDCIIELETPYYEYSVAILYPSCYRSLRIIGGKLRIGPVPALLLGLERTLALASRNGVIVEVSPGLLRIHVRGSLRIGLTGEVGTYHIFIEDLIDWTIVQAPLHGYGNARSSRGAILLSKGEEGVISYSLTNPSSESGIVEVRLPFLGESAVLEEPYGSVDIPISLDLIRVPLPPGFHGCLNVELSKKKTLLRMVRRFRGQ